MMDLIFPEPVLGLPEADIPIKGAHAFLLQGSGHQILFMQFEEDTDLPEHMHESQWGIVMEGRIEMTVEGKTAVYGKGERYYIRRA